MTSAWLTWKKSNEIVSVIRIEDISAINKVFDAKQDTVCITLKSGKEFNWSGPAGSISVQGLYDSMQEVRMANEAKESRS